jgi:Tfp pilus assembly protein PilV
MMRIFRRQDGLTLIETTVSLLIFSLVTLGLTPVLIGSLRGSTKSRSYTVAKNSATQAMERIRGLPYFESTKGVASPTRRDVLDLYFPDLGSGYSAGKFTTTCTTTTQTPSASGAAACPPKLADGTTALPTNVTLVFEAEFVKAGTTSGGQQSFTVVTPPAGYSWATLANETPPAQLLRMTVIASWPMGGSTKTFRLSSLFGERSLSPDKVRGDARLDFAIQSATSYRADDGRVTTLTQIGGSSTSGIETRSVSTADQDTRAARLTLGQEEFNGVPGTVLQDFIGASSLLHAPPDSFYAPNTSQAELTATYQSSPTAPVTPIAYVQGTNAVNNGARVINELPGAEGSFTLNAGEPIYWTDNQADTGSRTELLLHNTRNVLQVRTGTMGLTGSTKTEATALSPTSGRKVQSTVSANLGRLDLFPTTYITVEQRAVVSLRNFDLDLQCTSTANSTTAQVTGTWTAQFKYWRDLTNNSTRDGGYSTEVTLSGSVAGGSEQLETIQTTNPLVYDDNQAIDDVYLFKTATKKGYLSDWSMKPQISWTEDPSGRTTTATVEGALQFISSPLNPAIEASALQVTLGKASCLAVDNR